MNSPPMIGAFFRTFNIVSLLRVNGAYKQSGIPVVVVFQRLFTLAFPGRTLFMLLKTASCHINWFRFTTMLSATVINGLIVCDDSAKKLRNTYTQLRSENFHHIQSNVSFGAFYLA